MTARDRFPRPPGDRTSRGEPRSFDSTRSDPTKIDYYGPAVIGATTIGNAATSAETLDEAIRLLGQLESDDYSRYVLDFIARGRRAADDAWRYADVVTVLIAASRLLRPERYLEIGVRRGRSMAAVASQRPSCSLIGIDLWQSGYAGMENPGPDHVRSELGRLGHVGSVELISGDSHSVLPRLFAARPELTFDLITVDGDHSRRGAARDLRDVLPRLRRAGALVFDDIAHPSHSYLRDVWRHEVASSAQFSTWEYADVGFGVAVAVRRW